MSRKEGRVRRWLIGAGVFTVLYAVTGFLILPPIARSQIEKHASEALKREVTVGKVSMNPFTFAVGIADLKVADPTNPGGLLASWKLVEVNFDPLPSLFGWRFYFDNIRVVEPRKWIRIDADGRLNFADLLETAPSGDETDEAEASSSGLPPIGVGLATIEGWAVDFTDESLQSPFHTVIGPMNFQLENLTTRPDEQSPYALKGTTNTGESFSWSGTVTVNPLGSNGSIQFVGFSVPKHAAYARAFSKAEARTGTVSFSTDYSVAVGADLLLKLANTHLSVDDITLGSAGIEEPQVAIKRIEVEMPEADGMRRTAHVSRVVLDGVDVAMERRNDGSIDLLDWIAVPEAPTDPAAEGGASADTGPAPSVTVDEITVSGARVTILDSTTPTPARLVVDQVDLTAKGAGTDLDREVDVALKMRLNEGGTITASGKVRPLPMAASFEVGGESVALAPFNPYAQQFADVTIAGGSITWSGTVKADQPPGGTLNGRWSGNLTLAGLSVLSNADQAELVSLDTLRLENTEFELEPLRVRAADVAIQHPQAHIAIDPEGRINLLAAMRIEQETTDDDATTAPAAEEERTSEVVARATRQRLPFDAQVDTISLSDGSFTFRDDSVPGGFSTSLKDFGGTITGLSSENLARADVDLQATLDGQAPLSITGSINPLAEDAYSDLAVVFSNINLPAFSPYSAKFIGQKIEKGKLRIDITYRVSQSELDGENEVLFDQFYLGEKVDSPDALKLPIGLALALLRDREGKINLNVPVRGNLDDPDFKYGSAVMKVIGNILVKAATSPFSMLGGIVGGGGAAEDLSYVDFASGSAELNEAALKKIELLNKALFERPALRLEIKSPPSPSTDRAGLLEAKFIDLLRAEKSAIAATAETTPASETEESAEGAPAELAPEEVNALVKRVFARLFPEEAAALAAANASTGTPEAEEAPVVDTSGATMKEKRPGLFSRILGSVLRRGDGAEKQPAVPDEPEASGGAAASSPPEPVPTLTVAEMRDRIMATIGVTEAEFRELASARARAVRDAILAPGGVEPERVFLVEAEIVPDGATGSAEGGRVFFGLQ